VGLWLTRTLTLPDGTRRTVRIAAIYQNGFIGFDSPAYLLPSGLFHRHAPQPGAELLLVDGTHRSCMIVGDGRVRSLR
jgi:hypothetical protein